MNIQIFCLFYIVVIALEAQLTIQYNIKIVNEHTTQKIAPAQKNKLDPSLISEFKIKF